MIADPRYALAGLAVGALVGLTGVGGSAVLAPMLVLLFGVKASVAVGTDLLYSVPTKLLAFGLHARRKTVDWSIVRPLLIGGLPGVAVGLAFVWWLRGHVDHKALEAVLRQAIGVAILLAAVGATASWFIRSRSRGAAGPATVAGDGALAESVDGGEAIAHGRLAKRIVAIGAVVGFLVSVTSIGSGSMTLPLLVFALPRAVLRRLVGSEIAFAAFLVPLAAIGHLGFGDADWRVAGSLLVGSLPGVWLGSRCAGVVSDGWLRPIVIGALAFAGARLV